MAANPSRKNAAPLPISALPMPVDDDPAAAAPASLPTNSEGKLSPAQRARLGLDIYGDDVPAAAPATNGNGPALAPAGPAAPAGAPAPAAPEPAATEFGFAEIDPFNGQAPTPEPKLAPAATSAPSALAGPRLAPATPGGRVQVRARRADELDDEEADKQARSASKRKVTIEERDGTPQLNRDRNVFTYGVSWTLFVLLLTAAISFAHSFTLSAGQSTGPGPLIPGLVAIAIGWVIVFAARGMGPNWVWWMLLPVVVFALGSFAYPAWYNGTLQKKALAYLSPAGSKATIDIDSNGIVSSTINTPAGCFAMTKSSSSGDVVVDVATYAPETAQQQATLALAPRFARTIQAGGDRVNSRTFTLPKGKTPADVTPRATAPIDCAQPITP